MSQVANIVRRFYAGGGGAQVVPFSIIAYNHSVSNKFVDLYFSRGVYASGGAITTSNLSLSFTAGGASNLAIASVKKADHHLSASASNLAGGESVIRVFLTVTGTPNSSEHYSISANEIIDSEDNALSSNTGDIYLNVNPFNLWDTEKPTTVTVTGAGISSLVDLMGNINLSQGTDADRPEYYNNSLARFVLSNTEWLSGATNASYAKQQANDFAIVIKNYSANQVGEASYGSIIGYMDTVANRGWVLRSLNTGGLNFVFIDNVGAAVSCTFANFEDQIGTFIIQQVSGVLSIYDENNNLLATANTAIGTITYSSVTGIFVGRRQQITTTYFNGQWESLAFYNQSFSSDQRQAIFNNIKLRAINRQATVTKYQFPVVNGSTDPDAKDTMQVFLGDVILKDGVYHLFYNGNAADGDIDRVFKATKTDDGTNTPFTKVLDVGLPKVILNVSSPSAFDDGEVYCRSVIWDVDHAKMYYTGRTTNDFTIGLATSTDLETFTKQGQVYTDGTDEIILFAVVKSGTGDYRAIATVTDASTISGYRRDYVTSADGISWTKQSNITSLFKVNAAFVFKIIKQNEIFYILTISEICDPTGATDRLDLYTTTDFVTLVYCGELVQRNEPSERSIGGSTVVLKNNSIDIFYTHLKNQNKHGFNGGEGYSSIRRAVLNKSVLQQATTVNEYPTWVKKYWPLNIESAIANTFYEYIDGQTTTFAGTKQWSIDGLNFFDFLGTGFSWPAIDISSYADSLALKMRVEIVTSGTINLFSIGTDIVVQLVNGNLRVALNNATKDYITNDDIAMPVGITDVGNHVYVGFIWHGGVLKLCVGNTIDIASTKTVDGAMTNILNGGSNVLICDGATIEAGRVVLMSGPTDQQWIDTDL